MNYLIEWNEENQKDFGDKNQILKHELHKNEIFSDEGIIELIDNYPQKDLEIFTMGFNPHGWGEWFLGRRDNLNGAQLLEAVKTGRVWLNLRRTNLSNPKIAKIAEQIFTEIKEKTGIATFKEDMGLLISSPNAHVYYHADTPLVMLWQIRGIKRVYLYPAEEPFISDSQIEAINLRENDEQLKFDKSFEDGAFVHDLKPGEFLTWKQNCPHRIENQDCVNISFSIEFLTPKSAWRANVIYANGCLRRYFGLNPSLKNSPKFLEPFKIIYARIIKVLGGYKGKKNLPQPSFSINPNKLDELIFDQGIKAPKKNIS